MPTLNIDEKIDELITAGATPEEISEAAKRRALEAKKAPFVAQLRDPETGAPVVSIQVNDRARLQAFFAAPIPSDNHPQLFYRDLSREIGIAIDITHDDQAIIDDLLIGALAFKS